MVPYTKLSLGLKDLSAGSSLYFTMVDLLLLVKSVSGAAIVKEVGTNLWQYSALFFILLGANL